MGETVLWDLWVPGVASQGVSFARGRCDRSKTILVHAAPSLLSVEVYTDQRVLLAQGIDLARTAETPMARLAWHEQQIKRQDIWPTPAEYGLPVLLAGGEIGILLAWWNDEEQQEWRWRLEFYNHR